MAAAIVSFLAEIERDHSPPRVAKSNAIAGAMHGCGQCTSHSCSLLPAPPSDGRPSELVLVPACSSKQTDVRLQIDVHLRCLPAAAERELAFALRSVFGSAAPPARVAEMPSHSPLMEFVLDGLGDRYAKNDYQRDGNCAAQDN